MYIVVDSEGVSSPVIAECSAIVTLGRRSLSGFRNAMGPKKLLVCSPGNVLGPPTEASVEIYEVSTVGITTGINGTGICGVTIVKTFLGVGPLVLSRGVSGKLTGYVPTHCTSLVSLGGTTVRRNVGTIRVVH